MTRRTAGRVPAIALVLAFAVLPVVGAPSAAADLPAGSVARPVHPHWSELTAAQHQALAPLSDDWNRLDTQTKKKWLEIAARYPKMSADEQRHTQQRMREWARLTPDQRRVARDSFARIRAMNPEQRAELLRKYRDLPDDQKKALAESKSSKVLVVPRSTIQAGPRKQMEESAKAPNPALAAARATAKPASLSIPGDKP